MLVVLYSDLKADLRGCVARVASHIGAPTNSAHLDAVAARCTFDVMKAYGSLFTPRSVRWKSGSAFNFVRKGVEGGYKDELPPHALDEYRRMCEEAWGGREGAEKSIGKVRARGLLPLSVWQA